MEIPEKYYMAGKHPTAQNVGQLKKLLDELPDSLRITDNWDQAPMVVVYNHGQDDMHLEFTESDES